MILRPPSTQPRRSLPTARRTAASQEEIEVRIGQVLVLLGPPIIVAGALVVAVLMALPRLLG